MQSGDLAALQIVCVLVETSNIFYQYKSEYFAWRSFLSVVIFFFFLENLVFIENSSICGFG